MNNCLGIKHILYILNDLIKLYYIKNIKIYVL